MKSLSEIDTTSKRASRAAGYSWGISEEVGKNIRMLEMFGLPGIKNLNDFFKKKKEYQFENLNEIKFEKIGYPLLFLPFVSRASEVIGKRLFLKLDDREFLLNFNNNIYSNFIKNNIIEVANFVSIQFLNNTDSFLEKEWNELYKLSENTFVEETDSLKQSGAGAGLTDND